MCWLRLGMVAAVVLLARVAIAAPTAEEISRAIEDLSDAEFEKRQSATELLWQAGDAAAEVLEQAAKSTDPEVRTRAAALVKKLRLGIRPDTPREVLLLIDQFRYAQAPEQRRQALAELQAKERWQTVLALIRGEQNPQERRNLATAVAGQAGKIVGPLVEKGDLAQAEEVLELVATVETGVPQLTAFLLLTGRIDKQIATLRERVADKSNVEAATRLAYLLRAKGDLSGAIEAAARTEDFVLRINLLAEAGRWSEAAPLAEEFHRRNASRLEGLAFATTFYRLAGNEAEHQRTLDALLKAANIERLKEIAPNRPADPFGPGANLAVNHFLTAAKTLLINERMDEALEILRKINPPFALLVYWQQHRHREALEFVQVAADTKLDRMWLENLPTPLSSPAVHPDYRVLLAAQVARQLRELGRKEQVEQIWKTLRELETQGNDRGRRLSLLSMYASQLGRHDEATRLGADAIKAGIAPAVIFSALARREAPQAMIWHERLLVIDPQIDRAKAIAIAISLVTPNPRRGGPPESWREMVNSVRDSVQKLEPRQKAERLIVLGQTCKARGDLDLARIMFDEAAAAYPAGSTQVGNLLADEGDWAGAAKHYAAAVKGNSSDALAGFLLGQAQLRTGEESASEKQLLQANLAMLAPEMRYAVARAVQNASLKPEVIRQHELTCRTALPDSQIIVNAGQELGNLLSADQPREAARHWQHLLLHGLNSSANFNEAEAYPALANLMHKGVARGAMAEGKPEEVAAELARCARIMPADIQAVVDLVPLLRQKGMPQIADGLFERAMAKHRQVLEEFPESATYLNNAAWVCARAQRELDEALKLANKAVELMPDEAAYQDTLAEVHFQRGDREAAVAAAQKCLEIAPANTMFAKRLAHFRDDELKTLDGDVE
jgi:tetratricopeptide (TPR) repeat protein